MHLVKPASRDPTILGIAIYIVRVNWDALIRGSSSVVVLYKLQSQCIYSYGMYIAFRNPDLWLRPVVHVAY